MEEGGGGSASDRTVEDVPAMAEAEEAPSPFLKPAIEIAEEEEEEEEEGELGEGAASRGGAMDDPVLAFLTTGECAAGGRSLLWGVSGTVADLDDDGGEEEEEGERGGRGPDMDRGGGASTPLSAATVGLEVACTMQRGHLLLHLPVAQELDVASIMDAGAATVPEEGEGAGAMSSAATQCVLVDTGSPTTMVRSQSTTWSFHGRCFSVTPNAEVLDGLQDFVGAEVDVLLGMDVMRHYDVVMHCQWERQEGRLVFSDSLMAPALQWLDAAADPPSLATTGTGEAGGAPSEKATLADVAVEVREFVECEMLDCMGIPIVAALVGPILRTRVYFDTGAMLSYVRDFSGADVGEEGGGAGERQDYSPFIGYFLTETRPVDFSLPCPFDASQPLPGTKAVAATPEASSPAAASSPDGASAPSHGAAASSGGDAASSSGATRRRLALTAEEEDVPPATSSAAAASGTAVVEAGSDVGEGDGVVVKKLASQRVSIECGVLPQSLQAMLMMANCGGILGTEMFRDFPICLMSSRQGRIWFAR